MKNINKVFMLIVTFLLLLVSACTTEKEIQSELPLNDEKVSINNLPNEDTNKLPEIPISLDLVSVSEYTEKPYIEVNNNVPYFTKTDLTTTSFEAYSPLDSLGRCGTACANIGKDIMPTEERGAIGMIKPSGWHTIKYENIDGLYLYNRCHLIGFQLTGENANEKNLITGTRYMNVEGMLPFENKVADYVKATDNHVLYRVTPIFDGDNLLTSGVLMEAYSVEDDGRGVCFNVFCYNIQPGIVIDYSNGDSRTSDGSLPYGSSETAKTQQNSGHSINDGSKVTYIANKNTGKFHYPDCSSVKQTKEKNKKYMTCTRDEIIAEGYTACERCEP